MKTGKTLVELAQEIERQKDARKDYVASLPAISAVSDNKVTMLNIQGIGQMPMKEVAHDQAAEKLGIPKKYYDRMRVESPELLDRNLNHWLSASKDKAMVRTMDGEVRALLSNKYRPLDNDQLAEAVLPVLATKNLMILSCEITEKRLYIKAVDKGIEKNIPAGGKMGAGHHIFDTLSPAITISNSEVGYGALSVLTSVYTRQCTNMATFAQRSMRKYHMGARHEGTAEAFELMSTKTRALTDAALWAQIGDVVGAAFDRAQFDSLVDTIQSASLDKIEGDPVKVIEVTAKRFDMGEGEKTSVLRHLIEGGDLSRYGLFNAVTRAAEDLEDYDRASDFERLGGQIIELPKRDWEVLAMAA